MATETKSEQVRVVFVGHSAVAEKVSALQTAYFFTDRKARADFKAFDKIMNRRGGKPPREGDEVPL